jgi:preprotein translocase subunit SecG
MTVLLVLQVLISAAMIALILIQRGRGAEAGAAFGSGASSTVFGARGSASFLTRTTAILAILFFTNCFMLSYLGGKHAPAKSLMERVVTTPAGKVPADTTPPASNAPDVPVKLETDKPEAPQTKADTPPPASSSGTTQAAEAGTTTVPAPESKPVDVPATPTAPAAPTN